MTGIACWARATIGQAAAPPRIVMNSRRRIASPRGFGQSIVAAQTSLVKGRPDVRFGSKADMCGATRDVRFGPTADIGSIIALFDQLIGAQQQRWRKGHSECVGGLKVDHQLIFGGLFNRQISRVCTMQNFVDETYDKFVTEQISRSVGEKSAFLRRFRPLVNRR